MREQQSYSTWAERKRSRQVLADWVSEMHWDWTVTLNFNTSDMTPDRAREAVAEWLGRLDFTRLGPGWQKKRPEIRTGGFFTMEHIESNLHVHGVIRSSKLVRNKLEEADDDQMERLWLASAKGRTFWAMRPHDIYGYVDYITKELIFPGRENNYFFASEFHSQPRARLREEKISSAPQWVRQRFWRAGEPDLDESDT